MPIQCASRGERSVVLAPARWLLSDGSGYEEGIGRAIVFSSASTSMPHVDSTDAGNIVLHDHEIKLRRVRDTQGVSISELLTWDPAKSSWELDGSLIGEAWMARERRRSELGPKATARACVEAEGDDVEFVRALRAAPGEVEGAKFPMRGTAAPQVDPSNALRADVYAWVTELGGGAL